MLEGIIFIILSYLSGSVMYSYFIPKLIKKVDITEKAQDRNPGATNAFKICGVPLGIVCLFLDIMKGAVPIYLSTFFVDVKSFWFALIVAAPTIGHAFPIFRKFKGGKCIATTFGITIGVLRMSAQFFMLAVIYIATSVVIKIKPDEKSTVITFAALALFQWFLPGLWTVKLGITIASIITIIRNFRDSGLKFKKFIETEDFVCSDEMKTE